VARAKRTDRADARRRYRVTQAEPDTTDDASEDDEPAPAATRSTGAPSRPQRQAVSSRPSGAGDAPPVRPGIFSAFKGAARPFNIREDIAYLPTLVLKTRAVWVPAAAAIVSGALFLIFQPLGSNGLANLLFQLFVLPPTIAGAFLAGVLAPRATYIAGGIAALVGALVFAAAVLLTPSNIYATPGTISTGASPSPAASASADPSASPSSSAAPAPVPDTTLPFDKTATILQSLLISVPFGIAIGGFGGYYKRFLYASNPNRQRRALQQQREKQQRQANKGQPPKRRF
jgi:hypothetical protein